MKFLFMNKKYWLLIFILLVIASCSEESTPISNTATVTSTLPFPEINTTSVPKPTLASQNFLEAWKQKDYETMYSLLSMDSKILTTEEQFIEIYKSADGEIGLSDLGLYPSGFPRRSSS